MLARMTSSEITEWAAFFRLEQEAIEKAREDAEAGATGEVRAPDPHMILGGMKGM